MFKESRDLISRNWMYFRQNWFRPLALAPTLTSIGVMIVATAFALLLDYLFVDNSNISVVYTLAVIVVSCMTPGYLYGTVASIVGMLGMNYFFMWPYWAFNFTQTGYPLTLLLLFCTSNLTSTLMTSYREQANRARLNEKNTTALYEMSNELLSCAQDDEAADIALKWMQQASGCTALLVEPPEKPPAGCLLLPIMVRDSAVCTIALQDKGRLEQDEALSGYLQLMANQFAMVLERRQLSKERNEAALEIETERLRSNLLRAISHDLRTPLTSITGASGVLIDNESSLSTEAREQLCKDIRDNAQWLIRMVENLLSVTRITNSNSAIKKSPEMPEEVVADAAAQIHRRFPGQPLSVKVPGQLVIVGMDATLITQVLINLIENAIYHSDNPGGLIEMSVTAEPEQVVFTVRDHGRGVDAARMQALFAGHIVSEHAVGDSHRGMGIGLSICSSVVKAHNGTISAGNAEGGGAVFSFTLPIDEVYSSDAGPSDDDDDELFDDKAL